MLIQQSIKKLQKEENFSKFACFIEILAECCEENVNYKNLARYLTQLDQNHFVIKEPVRFVSFCIKINKFENIREVIDEYLDKCEPKEKGILCATIVAHFNKPPEFID